MVFQPQRAQNFFWSLHFSLDKHVSAAYYGIVVVRARSKKSIARSEKIFAGGKVKRKIYIYGIVTGGRTRILTYATQQTRGACVHEVEAEDTPAAKRAAAREHAAKCMRTGGGQ